MGKLQYSVKTWCKTSKTLLLNHFEESHFMSISFKHFCSTNVCDYYEQNIQWMCSEMLFLAFTHFQDTPFLIYHYFLIYIQLANI